MNPCLQATMEAVVTSVCENIADSEEGEGGMAKPKLSPEGNNKENQARNVFFHF